MHTRKSIRPASVLVFDLVKHSQRPDDESLAIQKRVEQCFVSTRVALELQDVDFRHTGDGYICVFWGDSSAHVLDFVNRAFALLQKELSPFAQRYRAGLSFGIVRVYRNELTQNEEHFDVPTITASRLQAVAAENQILCSEIFSDAFQHTHRQFLAEPMQVFECKDREIRGKIVGLVDLNKLRAILTRSLKKQLTRDPGYVNSRKCILLLDDELGMSEVVAVLIKDEYPDCNVDIFTHPNEALAAFEAGKYLLVITDHVMPGMTGTALTGELTGRDIKQIVVLHTAYYSAKVSTDFIRAGGTLVIQKPSSGEEFIKRLREALQEHELALAYRQLEALCDDPAVTIHLIKLTADAYEAVIEKTKQLNNIAASLLRHKAQSIFAGLEAGLAYGGDIDMLLKIGFAHLSRISRFTKIVGNSELKSVEEFIAQYFTDLKTLHKGVRFTLTLEKAKMGDSLLAIGSIIILAIIELVDNSIDAISGSGDVTCEIAVLNNIGVLSITVSDSGAGIPKEQLSKLFEVGASTKGIGRGLGLHLISEILEIIGGKIAYRNGSGGNFNVVIPLQHSIREGEQPHKADSSLTQS